MQNPNYNHLNIEKQIYDYWEKNKFFKPDKSKKKYFSIVIPPPNVTGSLHMGHALNNSLQDLLVRYYRMNGYETLWQPGTDHAGIATQAVVEKKLSEKGINKNKIGRDNFVKEVWKWKEESGDQILNQLKKLGCSCDWSRNRFTMDKDLSEAVIKTFVQLYKKKIIYKDTKLVNWDTKLETAISDLEVEQKEVQSNLYYIKYKIDGEDNFLTIATTRPETMLGDTAVAVNPQDERYRNYIGRKIIVPIVERKVKIIVDKYVSIDQGSGALKVTPAHDFNDFEIGRRHKLEFINIFEKNGKLNNKVGIECLIESALGMSNIKEIAISSNRLEALHFGVADYAASLRARTVVIGGLNPDYPGDQWHHGLSQLVMTCRAYGLRAIDGPFGDFKDSDGYIASAKRAAAIGIEGKWAIHPSQIDLGNKVFSPPTTEVDRAKKILEELAKAAKEGKGAAQLDGRMIDAASARMAENIVNINKLIESK